MPAPKDKKRAAALKQVGVQLRRYSASLMTEPEELWKRVEAGVDEKIVEREAGEDK